MRLSEDAGYSAIHSWIRVHKHKPDVCEECKIAPPRDVASVDGKCVRDINNYRWLCRSCHKKQDITDEVRRKTSESLKGNKNPMFGKTHTDEVKRRMSITNKRFGKQNGMYGKPRSDEDKKKISIAVRKALAKKNDK